VSFSGNYNSNTHYSLLYLQKIIWNRSEYCGQKKCTRVHVCFWGAPKTWNILYKHTSKNLRIHCLTPHSARTRACFWREAPPFSPRSHSQRESISPSSSSRLLGLATIYIAKSASSSFAEPISTPLCLATGQSHYALSYHVPPASSGGHAWWGASRALITAGRSGLRP